MRYRIVTSSRSSALGEGLTYESAEPLKPGTLVAVPLRGSTIEGVVLEEMKLGTESFDVKSIAGIVSPSPVLPHDLIDLLPWLQEETFTTMRILLRSMLPSPPWKNLIAKEENRSFITIKKQRDRSSSPLSPLLVMGTQRERREFILDVILQVIDSKKDVILLAPDIAACEEWNTLLSEYIHEDSIIQLAGATTAGQRKACRRMHAGEQLIVIGTRAAVFAPLHHLGLIVMDEEQEWTYKNRQTPYYHTRDVAWERAERANATLLFSSACPSLETWKRVQEGSITLHDTQTDHRDNVHVIDLKDATFGASYPLTSNLIIAIQHRLEKKEQSILLLNHRGMASGMICAECGHRLESQATGHPLTVHHNVKNHPFLWDHVTGTTEPVPDICPQCHSSNLRPIGAGTQGVETLLKKFFPDARIRRIDSETLESKKDLIAIKKLLTKQEVDILIGTQPVVSLAGSPTVTLLAVLVADIGLSAPTIRASERTVGLLARMRSMNPEAEMFIQTFRPESLEMRALSTGHLDEFLSHELSIRARGGFPPTANVIALIARGPGAKEKALALRIQIEDQQKKDPSALEAVSMQPSFSAKNVWYTVLRGTFPDRILRAIDVRGVFMDVNPLDVI
jgi:primosomal protein N' (replication factor Y)